jgi:hypothetical protein
MGTQPPLRLLSRAALVALPLAGCLLGAPTDAEAQVTEPNGTQVPSLAGMKPTLQEYFDSQMENINAVMEASAEPGVFSPLCNFTATFVLSESSAEAGLAWYNVPATPTEKPTPLYQILPESRQVGQVVNAADIRSSADYKGGLIGFALTKKFNGATGPSTPIYYSEYQRNENCTGCTMPGHWKMMLAYRSNAHQSSYYLAFEDWEGANNTTWHGNDGDFNDKVFRVTGVSCPGGGEPCETGKLGLCAAGLTECSFSGTPVCKQQTAETAEKCDNVDNDCNGLVDDGNLCSDGQVCVRGKCVARCNTGEFTCEAPLVCGNDGYCIEAACKDVVCDAPLVCRGGECVGACKDVVCPIGQVCQGDRCLDPCAGVTCAAGSRCNRGVCVGDCTCTGCPQGQACARDGRCVAPGCEALSCAAGQGCRNGQCVDACDGARCPGNAMCASGSCGEPAGGSVGGGNAGGMSNGSGGFVIGVGGNTSTGTGTGTAVTPGGANGQAGSGAGRQSSNAGCGCRTAPSSSETLLGALFGGVLAGFALARRRRARRNSDGAVSAD